ncbi:MAG TPA: ATP-binding protein [Solirubrobacteraceae bacterium]|nr:ATP-binding protein [Solirubrobacteraceae bacterium]
MIKRRVATEVAALLEQQPAVALVGPRQSGKTTLALAITEGRRSVYLDLESAADRARLAEPALYLADHAEELVILDEIHRAPGLFEALRGVIDRGRREGRGTGRFLLLGSAAIELLAQAGESLAGRIAFVELTPLDITEVGGERVDELWVRGGFPDSFLAADEAISLRWREDFLRTYLERDIPQLGPRIPAETLRRLWTMLAHHQGGLLNAAQLARGLGVSGTTIAHYLDLMVDLLLVRRLPPLLPNLGKRLVRSPKVYVRDSGLLHALLGLIDKEALLGHPVLGPSWEGMVIENIIAAAGPRAQASFFRTSHGAEIDLVLGWPGGQTWAIEIKRSLAPRVERGAHSALADLAPARALVVYPGGDRYPLSPSIEAIGLPELCGQAIQAGRGRSRPL